jgi:CheY-like chemotaxis protein
MEDTKTFFLIDDDADDRMIFKEALECLEESFNYIEATDGQEALDMLKRERIKVPEVIFLDLNMPKVGGYEVLVHIKEIPLYKSVPIFIYTTSSNKFDIDRCLQAGAAGFITKHSSFDDLCAELRLLVEKI